MKSQICYLQSKIKNPCTSGLLFLLFVLANINVAVANNRQWDCIEFSINEHKRQRESLFELLKVPADKRKYVKIYVATSDLNGDGIDEMFTYIEGVPYCGNQTGCYIKTYLEKKNEFVRLLKPGLPTFWKFDVERNKEQKYVCVSSDFTDGWRKIRLKNEFILAFDGQFYKRINK